MSEHKMGDEGILVEEKPGAPGTGTEPEVDYKTWAKPMLIERIDGLEMQIGNLLVMVESLQRRNELLLKRASKDKLKAEAYREMMHEILIDAVADHHDEAPDYEAKEEAAHPGAT